MGGGDENKAQDNEEDISQGNYGSYGLIQSTEEKSVSFTYLSGIKADLDGQEVWVRGRVHTIRSKGKTCFIVLRQRVYTAQVVVEFSTFMMLRYHCLLARSLASRC